MKLYGCPGTRSVRVAWTLEEMGIDYAYQHVDLGKGGGRDAAYLAINPGGKVPALEHEGYVITESAAICLWLVGKYPERGLAPRTGTPDHGEFLRWVQFVVAELEQPLWTIAKHKFALPEARRVPAIVETAQWEYQVAASLLGEWLGDRLFLVGDAFSIADVLAAHTLSWARKAAPDVQVPGLNAYADRMLERPALARAREREAS